MPFNFSKFIVLFYFATGGLFAIGQPGTEQLLSYVLRCLPVNANVRNKTVKPII
jgi:hypothetical protein